MGAARACFNRIAVACPMYHRALVSLGCLSSVCALPGRARIAGCAAMVEHGGNLPTSEKLAEIQPGVTSKDEVIKILGSPSSVSIFNDKSWYYISRRTGQTAFFEPDLLDQQVYIVSFDDQGVVKTVDHKGVQDARAIEPVPRATPAPGRELTFLERVIGNVGKLNNAGSSKNSGRASSGGGPT